MAVQHPKPPRVDSKKSRVYRITSSSISSSRPRVLNNSTLFNRLTVVWVQNNGVPFDTTGFFARLSRGNTRVATASFDRFGVVRFNGIRVLTNVAYTLRLFSRNGTLFRTRTIPAGVETFAIIG